MGREIIIENPEVNQVIHRGYGVSIDQEYLTDILGVTPQSHPMAIILCAGIGLEGKQLRELGWDQENITFVDLFRPDPDELTKNDIEWVTESSWLFWDINDLETAIRDKGQLNPNILSHKGAYDFVLLSFPFGFDNRSSKEVKVEKDKYDDVVDFFKKPQHGVSYIRSSG